MGHRVGCVSFWEFRFFVLWIEELRMGVLDGVMWFKLRFGELNVG